MPEINMPEPKASPEGGIIQIGADKLHDENISGEGIKVGVIDTGIDYNHPQLKDVYKDGYDFVNNDNDPMETTYKDWKNSGGYPEIMQGNTYYTSHGTHVSGTIAANGDEGNAKGVAPNVDLYSYKVLGPYGSGQTAWILGGIDKAVEDGMDVINLSLGASVNDPLSPTSIAVNNAAKAGVIPVVAAGNAGPKEYTLGSPGTSPLAITVGASDTNLTIPTFDGSIAEKKIAIKLLANNYDFDLGSLKDQTFEMVNCGLGKTSDFNDKDLTGKIAVIQRGEISLNEKIANAKKAGAQLVFIYNNVDGHINAYLEEDYNFIPTFNLTKTDGEELINNIESNNKFTFNVISSEIQKGDKLADFSSRGPVGRTSEIKPDVVAPGVNIYSTYPEFINDKEDGEDYSKAYAKISGTSMATPHVTGVVALMLENAKDNGETMSAEDVKVALMNNTEELNGDYNVYEKGAGRVNAYDAVHDNVTIAINNKTKTVENSEIVEIDNITGSLQFGNAYHGEGIKERTIKITNDSDSDKEFKISITNSTPKGSVKDGSANGVKLEVPDTIKVLAKGSVDINTSINIPESAEKGFYEGTVTLTNTSDDKEDYLIPYAIRYSEKGISGFRLTSNTESNDVDFYHQFYTPVIGYYVSYNSEIKSQRVYLKDAETGKRVGLVGEYKNMNPMPNVTYFEMNGFSGRYIPMVGEYFENRIVRAEEGHYKLELEAIDAEGNIYTAEEDLFVDNTSPEIIFEEGKDIGIHEISEEDYTVEDGIKAYYVKGRVYDDTINKLHELGYTHDVFGNPITQQSNTVLYYQQLPNERLPWYSGNLNIDSEGNFNMGIAPEEIENNPTEVSLFAFDRATAGDYNYEKYSSFIKEGEAYGDITYDKEKVVNGDTQTGHMSFKNMKAVTKLEFVVGFSKSAYDLESVNINPEFKKYVESKGLEVKVMHEPTSDSNIEWARGEAHKVVVEISGSDSGIDIIEKMPVVDIKAKVLDYDIYDFYTHKFYTKTNSKNKYTDANGDVKTLYIMSHINTYQFIPETTSSNIYYISSQGFFDENGWSRKLDYTKMDAKAYVITPDGERYDATINAGGIATVMTPKSIEDGEFYVEVPGHFKNKVKVQLGQVFEGEVAGVSRVDRILTAYAGDMNGDDIINDKDKEILSADIGKTTTVEENYLASDINKDRVVDDKDLEYINNNMEMVNPRLVEDAEVAVATLKDSQDVKDVQSAVDKVNLLPECAKKQELLDAIKQIADPINLGIATKAVEKAEESKTQEDVDAAVVLVNALPDSDAKNSLFERLNKVQDDINNVIALENATKAVEKAEESKAQADVETARALVNALSESDAKNSLIERLNQVQDYINNEIALESATKAVEKAEEFKTQADVDVARTLVDALSESDAKNNLIERLNQVQDAINSATALENATKAVEKAEATKIQADVDVASVLVDALPDSDAKNSLIERLNKVQDVINNATALENATKAVEKAEKSKTQIDVDVARSLVKKLPNSDAKKSLSERLNKVQDAIDLAMAIEEARKAVEKAEKSKDKDDIKTAKKLVKDLPDGAVKTELLDRLKELSKNLPQTGAAMGAAGMLAIGGVSCIAGVALLKKKKNTDQ